MAIAHRLSSMRSADQVAVLEVGGLCVRRARSRVPDLFAFALCHYHREAASCKKVHSMSS